MEDYNIWKDLFDTLQSFPNWLKVVAMLIPAATLITISGQFLNYRIRRAEITHGREAPPPLPQWEPVVSASPPLPPPPEMDLLEQELELPRLGVTKEEDRREE
ncbi:MAG: hypothetical protein GKR97_14310 [Rhizobiaceae bacterium]|nr:hypothetical protein [Rhizobiaceae bacterium]